MSHEGLTRSEAVRVWLLGRFRISVGSRTIQDDAWRLKKAAALVKLLALSSGHRLHREQVMYTLWPDSGRKAASNNLRKTLHAARRILDPDAGSRYLASEDESLVLCPGENLWVDVEAFQEAAAAAHRAKDPATYRAALDLYEGELLPADRYDEWTEERRRFLRETYLSLALGLARLHEERGDYERGLEVLHTVLAEDPSNEQARMGLMRLYVLLGREGEALAQYERLRQILHIQFGSEPSTAPRRLRDEIVAGRLSLSPRPPVSPPSPDPAHASRHNLPAPRNSFVGWNREMLEVKRALAMTRLLTLTGAGGTGKTRLALEIARDLVTTYTDGVWVIELAELSEGDLVPQAVAETLRVHEQPSQLLTDTLIDALRPKSILLVLDNCEHLVEAVARLADTLLNSCPRVKILATSREVLDVRGEVSWIVPSLSVPDSQGSPTVEQLERYESTRLFVERARQRDVAFALTPANARTVAKICHRVDGIPLAIELAAARVGTISVEQISERLEYCLMLLTGGGRTTIPRQRTLRGTLDWSHKLLSEPERVLFRRLSVFTGGWRQQRS